MKPRCIQPATGKIVNGLTTGGEIRLDVVNQEAWQHFELDKEYYVDFTPAKQD